MAIPKPHNRGAPTAQATTTPVTTDPNGWVGATVSTKKMHFDQLTTYIAGQSWDVDWLQVVRGRDDDTRPFESDAHPVYQQYNLIKGMELKVTSPLQPSQVSDTKDMTLKGTANVYGVLTPTEGCVFLADIGDGREGMFAVTSTNRLSHYQSTIHEIEYQLIRFSDAKLRDELMRKVQKTEVFHKDFLDTGNSPLLSEEKTGFVNNMKEHYARLISLYFHDFYSRDYKTLLVPNQREVTYDPFLLKYVKTILSNDDHPILRHITEFNVHGDQAMYEFTFWHCLEVMDDSMLAMSTHKAGLVDISRFFSIKPTLNSIYYTGVERVVYPDMWPTNVDMGYNGAKSGKPDLENIVRGSARFRELSRLTRRDFEMDPSMEMYEAESVDRAPQIKRVTVDDYYVLSEDFYLHAPDKKLSKLEALTMAALKGKAIDIQVLDHLCTQAVKWDNVERFYYFPILFTLLKIYKRRIE